MAVEHGVPLGDLSCGLVEAHLAKCSKELGDAELLERFCEAESLRQIDSRAEHWVSRLPCEMQERFGRLCSGRLEARLKEAFRVEGFKISTRLSCTRNGFDGSPLGFSPKHAHFLDVWLAEGHLRAQALVESSTSRFGSLNLAFELDLRAAGGADGAWLQFMRGFAVALEHAEFGDLGSKWGRKGELGPSERKAQAQAFASAMELSDMEGGIPKAGLSKSKPRRC